MATTYSTSLKLTLIGDGLESGIWGQTTNTNLGTLLEQAITGYVAIDMADSNVTLTNLNGTFDQARNAVIELTGTNSAVRDVIPPVVEKLYTIFNNTTGGYAIRVIGASGTGVTIPNGMTTLVYCNGTNFISGLSGAPNNFNVAGNIVATANVTANNVTITNNASATNITSTNVAATTVTSTNATITNVSTGNAVITGGSATGLSTVNATSSTITNFTSSNVTVTGGTINGATVGASSAAAITGTTITANTQFSGPGTGLTGTAASLTVGNATNATNASNAVAGSSLASGAAKAWVSFDGNGTIIKAFNVSTVTRTSTGQYTVTFTTAMADANYCTLVTPQTTNNSTIRVIGYVQNGSVSTGSVGVTAHNLGAYIDPTAMYVVIFD